jgi:hypothetical protein
MACQGRATLAEMGSLFRLLLHDLSAHLSYMRVLRRSASGFAPCSRRTPSIPGDHRCLAIPVLIPNTVVKQVPPMIVPCAKVGYCRVFSAPTGFRGRYFYVPTFPPHPDVTSWCLECHGSQAGSMGLDAFGPVPCSYIAVARGR